MTEFALVPEPAGFHGLSKRWRPSCRRCGTQDSSTRPVFCHNRTLGFLWRIGQLRQRFAVECAACQPLFALPNSPIFWRRVDDASGDPQWRRFEGTAKEVLHEMDEAGIPSRLTKEMMEHFFPSNCNCKSTNSPDGPSCCALMRLPNNYQS